MAIKLDNAFDSINLDLLSIVPNPTIAGPIMAGPISWQCSLECG